MTTTYMTTILHAIDIQAVIPHRYPFQLIDRVIEYRPGEQITALKAVTIGEPFFSGHFPDLPIMPGVLVIEALAQTASVLLELTGSGWVPGAPVPKSEGSQVGVLGNVKVNMIRPVWPGCFLRLHARVDWRKDTATALKVEAYADDELCAQGSMVVALTEKQKLLLQDESHETN